MSIERELIAINPLKDLETPSSCRSNWIPCYEGNSHFVFCTPRQKYSAKVTVTFRKLSFLPRGGWIGYLPDRLIGRPNKHLFAILPLVNNVQNVARSEEHTSELQSLAYLVCRLLLEKKKNQKIQYTNYDELHLYRPGNGQHLHALRRACC